MPTEPSPTDPLPVQGGGVGHILVGVLAVGLLVLLMLTAAARVDRAPALWLAAGLFLLPYLYAAYVSAVFAVWCLLPDRRSLPVLGALGLGVATVLWGPSLARWSESAEGEPLTVMTWNLRRLWGGAQDGGDPFSCVVQAVEAANPDILTVQEVSRDNIRALEARLGMQCVHGTYTPGGSDEQGGLAACARGAWQLRDGHVQPYVGDDWQYVRAEVGRGPHVVNVLGVHLSPFNLGVGGVERVAAGQANQSAALVERVERFRDPTVVAGDFNSTRDFWLHAALRSHLVDTWEQGGLGLGATARLMDWLPLRIDYVYASNAFAVQEASVAAPGCSDHRPVLTRMVLRDRSLGVEIEPGR